VAVDRSLRVGDDRPLNAWVVFEARPPTPVGRTSLRLMSKRALAAVRLTAIEEHPDLVIPGKPPRQILADPGLIPCDDDEVPD